MASETWPENAPLITRLTPDEEQPAETQMAAGLSASERIPVEIWHRILRLAIACALVPREDDNFFQRRAVAESGCAKILEYVKSERIRTNLRLVCQSWDRFLEEHSDRLVYHSWTAGDGWPPITKWERVVTPEDIKCKCRRRCTLPRSVRERIGGTKGDRVLWADTLDELIRADRAFMNSRHKSVAVLDFFTDSFVRPGRFSSATMLCNDLMTPGAILSSSYQNIMHLSVTISPPFDPSFRLNLPRLTSLSISRTWGLEPDEDEGSTNQPDIGCWNLPKLRCITIMGNFQERGTYALLHQVGRAVTECHFVRVIFRGNCPDTPVWKEIWPYLPALKVLGATFRKLATLSPPSNFRDGSVNLVVHCDKLHGLFVRENEVIAQFWRNWATSAVNEVTLDVSWVELINSMDTYPKGSGVEVGETDLKIIDILSKLGNGLRDRDGILLDRTVRARIGKAVERHGTS